VIQEEQLREGLAAGRVQGEALLSVSSRVAPLVALRYSLRFAPATQGDTAGLQGGPRQLKQTWQVEEELAAQFFLGTLCRITKSAKGKYEK
jgi:hypothetical protein